MKDKKVKEMSNREALDYYCKKQMKVKKRIRKLENEIRPLAGFYERRPEHEKARHDAISAELKELRQKCWDYEQKIRAYGEAVRYTYGLLTERFYPKEKFHETESGFILGGSRYAFDNGMCSVSNGFAQVDTTQDASYYGVWTNPSSFKIVSYAEGDVHHSTYESAEEYIKALRELCDCDYVIAIDTMRSESIKAEFVKLGLMDLLHKSYQD